MSKEDRIEKKIEIKIVNHHITDIVELYSFSAYLYIYSYLFLLFFNKPFLQCSIIHILFHSFTTQFLNYNIIKYIQHPYWRYHLTDIAAPQLINALYNIKINTEFYLFGSNIDLYLIIPINIIFLSFLNKIFINEDKRSINTRYMTSLLFFVFYFF